MKPATDHLSLATSCLTRRSLFQSVGSGVCGAALTYLLGRDFFGESNLLASDAVEGVANGRPSGFDLLPKRPHHEPKAKAVIQLFMNGGPSQMDLFDPKEELDKHDGEAYFEKIAGEVESPKDAGALLRSPFRFQQYGRSGMWVSELLPHLAQHVDEIALIRSMHTVNVTHEPAIYKIHSGRQQPGLPAWGSWVVYGLGSENQNLPAYVVLDDPLGLPVNGVESWQAGHLPPLYQGTRFRSTGSPVLNLKPEIEQPDSVVQVERNLVAQLDRIHRGQRPGYQELDARIASYALAARMQLAASDALDLSQETDATRKMYGLDNETTESYGRRCLIARRLVERGVRFVQLYINGQIWDNHENIAKNLPAACERTDKPIGGLLQDLKRCGLMESTLVVWGGEFGRLPIAQGRKDVKTAGRDHNKNAMVTWMAGPGIKSGTVYGTTDELGFAAVENKVTVQDWHATMLHLLGLNYEQIFFERDGLREKLTSVFETRVIDGILA